MTHFTIELWLVRLDHLLTAFPTNLGHTSVVSLTSKIVPTPICVDSFDCTNDFTRPDLDD
ncbi:hypothetical protein YC2023_017345 [Brassica napus]